MIAVFDPDRGRWFLEGKREKPQVLFQFFGKVKSSEEFPLTEVLQKTLLASFGASVLPLALISK